MTLERQLASMSGRIEYAMKTPHQITFLMLAGSVLVGGALVGGAVPAQAGGGANDNLNAPAHDFSRITVHPFAGALGAGPERFLR